MTFGGSKTTTPPFYPSTGRQWFGLVLAVGGILAVEGLSDFLGRTPGSTGILLLVVLFVTYWSGLRMGLVTCALVGAYALIAFPKESALFHYAAAEHSLHMSGVAFTPFVVLFMGYVQTRLRKSKVKEYEAKAIAEAESERVQAHLARLDLLNRITRAIGERQDLQSIYQVVIGSLEERLPVDFGCVCLYDRATGTLNISKVGGKGFSIASDAHLAQDAEIEIAESDLAKCVQGHLVYEPDLSEIKASFTQQLANSGMGSLVASPLVVESQVFGVLIAARKEANAFSSAECEFLRQLSEHVALAAHQAELHIALQTAYDDLRQTQQAVLHQERLRALGQMASGIAHDINNAISPIALYSESLLKNERTLSPKAREYLEIISRSIDDVANTVSRMREFYRQREPQLVLSRLDLSQIVEGVLDFSKMRWNTLPEEAAIEVKTELAADLPPVMGVESEIREMLTNLIFNCVDAMPNGGKLTIRTSAAKLEDGLGSHVRLEVIDSGIGMDEETKRQCLEPFFTTKGERGTGLGLAMVYGIAKRHRADLEVHSTPGEGTTVRLVFPVATSVPHVGQAPSAPLALHRMRILIVDDDPLLLRSLRDTLEAEGHSVVAANGGQAGIDAFRASAGGSQPFSVVITDLGMPDVDGRKVAAAIKECAPGTQVILLTGWGQRLAAEGEIPPHVDCLLNKPPKLRDLHEALALRQAEAS